MRGGGSIRRPRLCGEMKRVRQKGVRKMLNFKIRGHSFGRWLKMLNREKDAAVEIVERVCDWTELRNQLTERAMKGVRDRRKVSDVLAERPKHAVSDWIEMECRLRQVVKKRVRDVVVCSEQLAVSIMKAVGGRIECSDQRAQMVKIHVRTLPHSVMPYFCLMSFKKT